MSIICFYAYFENNIHHEGKTKLIQDECDK